MRCKDTEKHIEAYLDGTLDSNIRSAFDEHLKTCARCQDALNRRQRLIAIFQHTPVPPFPKNLTQRIMSEAESRVGKISQRVHAAPSARPGRFERAFSRAAVAAVLMIGLAAGSLLGWSAWRGEAAPSASDDPGSVNVEVVYSLDVFGTAPYGSIESAFTTAENGGKEM